MRPLGTLSCGTLACAILTCAILTCATALAAAVSGASPAAANDIIQEWATVKPPPVPELRPAIVDPKTTALLILDLMKANCGQRPRCVATVPNIKKLLDQARALDMMVFYTLVGSDPTPQKQVDPGLAARPGEYVVRGGADKFIDSPLEERLKAKGIRTVIVTGSSAQGAVVGTTNGAVQRGFKAVVPVDGMSSEDLYDEQYAAWHLYKGGPVALVESVILTRSDMIKFAE